MPKPLAPTFATVYGSVALDLQKRLGDAQAAQMGPPVNEDIEPAGDDARVKAWNARAPEATDQAMWALAQQKYAEHTRAGLPLEKAIAATAEDLTHFRYTERLKLYTFGQVGLREQVKEAARIAKLAKRESTPDPQPPPPTMPSGQMTNVETLAGPAPAAGLIPPPTAAPLSMPAPGIPPATDGGMPGGMPGASMPGMPPQPPGAAPPGPAMPRGY